MSPSAAEILQALRLDREQVLIQPLERSTRRQNQALLLLKPECFLQGEASATAVTELILVGLARWGAEVAGTALVDGSLLERLGTIDRHYRAASELSRGASERLDRAERARLAALCERDPESPLFGGHEFLALHPELSPEALDQAWFERRPRKVRSGFYGVPFEHGDVPCLLVNGFYPAQARHFTAPGRKVALMLLHSELPWRSLRREMLGDTYPEKASPGSIRRELFERRAELGLPRVDITANFVHLSAGPFEAAWELINFFGGIEGGGFTLDQCRISAFWAEAGGRPEVLDQLVRTGRWQPRGLSEDLFGATEELDARAAAFLAARIG